MFRGKVLSHKTKTKNSIPSVPGCLKAACHDLARFRCHFLFYLGVFTLALCWFLPSFVPLSYNYLETSQTYCSLLFIPVKVLCAAESATSWLFLSLLRSVMSGMLYEIRLIIETMCWGNAVKSLLGLSAMSRINRRVGKEKWTSKVHIILVIWRSKTRGISAVGMLKRQKANKRLLENILAIKKYRRTIMWHAIIFGNSNKLVSVRLVNYTTFHKFQVSWHYKQFCEIMIMIILIFTSSGISQNVFNKCGNIFGHFWFMSKNKSHWEILCEHTNSFSKSLKYKPWCFVAIFLNYKVQNVIMIQSFVW